MKKFISVFTALVMLTALAVFSVPCAAESKAAFEQDGIKLDSVPEGYTVELDKDDEGIRYLTIGPDDSANPVFFVSVTPLDDELAMLAELSADMTDEKLSEYADYFIEDYNEPSVHIAETEHGSPLLVIDENGDDGDNGEIIGLHNGYIIDLAIVSLSEDPLDEKDFELGIKILSDLWVE